MNRDEASPITQSLLDPGVQRCPWSMYQELHANAPVYRLPETGYYVVSDSELVRSLLNDHETFSSRSGQSKGIQPDLAQQRAERLEKEGWTYTRTLHGVDPPEHTRYRRLVGRVFSPRRVRELAPRIEALTHSLIDAFERDGQCDFYAQFAHPLPATIIAEQIGLDASQIGLFKQWGDAMLAHSSRVLTPEESKRAIDLELQAQQHFARVFDDRRANPTGDIMSALVATESGEDPLTMEELQDLMLQFVTGGFETVTTGLAHAMWLLTRHPDQRELIEQDRSLVKAFIEEALRIESPVQGQARQATRDVELGGVKIDAGSIVIPRFGAANRDPDEYADPDRFDVMRANASSHLAFGAGVHFCIGAPLARLELQIAFDALFDRLEGFELQRELTDSDFLPSLFYLPLRSLPITFRSRAR